MPQPQNGRNIIITEIPWRRTTERKWKCSRSVVSNSLQPHRPYPGEGNGNPLQYSCLENPMDRGAWWATVHEVAKSQTWLNDFIQTVACQAPLFMGFPGQNIGVGCHFLLQGILLTRGLNRSPACRQILYHLSHQSVLVFLPGESHRQRNLTSYSL